MLTFHKTKHRTHQLSSDLQSSNNQKCFTNLFMTTTQSSLRLCFSFCLQCGFQEDDSRSTFYHPKSISTPRTNQCQQETQQRSQLKRSEPSSDRGIINNQRMSNAKSKHTLQKNFYFPKLACLIMKIVCNFLYYYVINYLCNFFLCFFKHVYYSIKNNRIKNKGTNYNPDYTSRAEGNDSKSLTTTYNTLPTLSTQPNEHCTTNNQPDEDNTYHPSRQQTNHSPNSASSTRLPRHRIPMSSITCPFFSSISQ